MKKLLSILFFLTLALSVFAQSGAMRQRLEIVQVKTQEDYVNIEVFQMHDNGKYYLSVGHLGFGDEIIQVHIDPLFELFIPLGSTATEALETLKAMREYYKMEPGDSAEIEGCLSLAFPNDEFETVYVNFRKVLLSRQLVLSLKREGYIRSTFINKSEFNSLINGVKMYSVIHPNE